ncbi:MAG: ABC transporter substrate-binding protein [Oscillospiraceae bacterium]|nr:ABC transporter substrate-binding protein [Oscillospiraceae bacterium]
MKKKTLTRLLAAALSLSLIFALSACGNNDAQPNQPDSPPAGAREIVLNLDGEPSSLNPMLMGGGKCANLMANTLYGFLWRVEYDDTLSCDLAGSYQLDRENMVIIAKLRSGLKFADGSPLTAEDVVCSILTSAADSGSNTSSIDLERTQAIDETTVQIGLRTLSYATMGDIGSIGIISKAWTEDGSNAEKKSADILASGAYTIEPWSTGNDMVYVKNPNYWNADKVIYDKITVKCIADETTRFLDYQNGGVDLIILAKGENIDSVENGLVPGTVQILPMQSVQGLAFDTENIDTFKNENLRLAIAHALDVEALVTAYCGPRYGVAQSVYPTSSPYCANTALKYDPELAKDYLQKYYDETGASSVEITLTAKTGGLDATLSEAIQYQLDQVLGIKVNVSVMDNASYFDAQAKGEQYASIVPLARGHYDPSKYMNAWMPQSSNSIMHMCSDELNGLLLETVNNMDLTGEERTAKLAELQKKLTGTGKFVPMFEDFICFALNGAIASVDGCVSGDGRLLQTLWLSEAPTPLPGG